MLTYTLDITEKSQWLRTTPGTAALAQPYYVTEAGLFFAGERFVTERTDKDSYLILYTFSGEGVLTQDGPADSGNCSDPGLPQAAALRNRCRL